MYSKIPMLGKLAEYGYAIASVEIRESTIAPFPAQIKDIKTAVRFLRSKADDFHLDPNNIFIFGESLGAHIGLLSVLTSDISDMDSDLLSEYSCKVSGIIDFSGPTDLLTLRDEDKDTSVFCPTDHLLGAKIFSVPELAKQASCSNYINREKRIPPILIFHGSEDPIVSIRQSELLFQKLIENDKEVEFYCIQSASHGGKSFWTKQVLDLIDEFIKEHIK